MKEMIRLAWNALTFKHEAYVQHAARNDVMKRGVLLLVVVSLLAGIISFGIDIFRGVTPVDTAAERQEIEEGFETAFRYMRMMQLDLPPDFEDMVYENAFPYIEIGLRIAELDTPLPHAVDGIFQAVGNLLSLPLARLAGWLGYAVWVLLFTKLLGGKGTVAQTLGTTALYSVPHILTVFNPVPCLNTLLWLAATVWGIAIYVKGLAVANKFGIGRALAATLLPALIQALLMLFGLFTFIIFMAAASN